MASRVFLENLDDEQTEGKKFLYRKMGEMDAQEEVFVLVLEEHYEFVQEKIRDFFRSNIFAEEPGKYRTNISSPPIVYTIINDYYLLNYLFCF